MQKHKIMHIKRIQGHGLKLYQEKFQVRHQVEYVHREGDQAAQRSGGVPILSYLKDKALRNMV